MGENKKKEMKVDLSCIKDKLQELFMRNPSSPLTKEECEELKTLDAPKKIFFKGWGGNLASQKQGHMVKWRRSKYKILPLLCLSSSDYKYDLELT